MLTPQQKQIRHATAVILFLVIPTIAMSYVYFQSISDIHMLVGSQPVNNTLMFGGSLLCASIFYAFRFRLLPTLIPLGVLFYILFKGIEKGYEGEFESFYITVFYLRLSLLSSIGWIIGYGLVRYTFASILIAIGIIVISVPLISQSDAWYTLHSVNDTAWELLILIGVLLFYCIYIIIASNTLFFFKYRNLNYWKGLIKRFVLTTILLILFIGSFALLFENKIQLRIQDLANNSQYGENSLLKKKENGNNPNNEGNSKEKQPQGQNELTAPNENLTMNDFLKVGGHNKKGNILLFAAYIDNFIENTNVPNPLYLSMYYYTLFDEKTETFLIDSAGTPDKDMMHPQLEKISLYTSKTDTNVLQFGKNNLYQKEVSIEVYKTNVDVSVFTAPTTAFYVQPITVEKEYAHQFRTAYKAKSKVSTLNSAYFIYNIDNPLVRSFQEQRIEVLREHNNYDEIDSTFMRYYTQYPTGKNYDSIRLLAYQLSNNQEKVIDKVIAIKNHFLQRNKKGKRIFQYSDNPGIPELPSASRLSYFLFENKKGYCAYYAGATLYLLRAMGIPSRIVGGFLTEDRASEANKGWYWYYADQAHAWVQVYFPDLGWIDFDTTIDNEDARESPQTDGTPPMQPPKAYFVLNGKFKTIDTINKTGTFLPSQYIIDDKTIAITTPQALQLDLSKASLRIDTAILPITKINIKDSITAIKYAKTDLDINGIITNNTQQLIPIDELYIKISTTDNEKVSNTSPATTHSAKLGFIFFQITLILVGLLLIFRSYLKWLLLRRKINHAKDDTQLINAQFRALYFYLKKMEFIDSENMLQEAQRLDAQYQLRLSTLVQLYQYEKYNITSNTHNHQHTINTKFIFQEAITVLNKQYKPFQRMRYWILN